MVAERADNFRSRLGRAGQEMQAYFGFRSQVSRMVGTKHLKALVRGEYLFIQGPPGSFQENPLNLSQRGRILQTVQAMASGGFWDSGPDSNKEAAEWIDREIGSKRVRYYRAGLFRSKTAERSPLEQIYYIFSWARFRDFLMSVSESALEEKIKKQLIQTACEEMTKVIPDWSVFKKL